MARRKASRTGGSGHNRKYPRNCKREDADLLSDEERPSYDSKIVSQYSTSPILGEMAVLGDAIPMPPRPKLQFTRTYVMEERTRVAPRSGNQFRIGPKFEPTEINRAIIVTATGEELVPVLNARIDRGFENLNGTWIGYKRNYFSLVACFQFENQTDDIWNERFHICDDYGCNRNLKCFALRLVPKSYEEDALVVLVQHTPKRDKGPQFSPPVYPAVCGQLPSHELIKQCSNVRNRERIEQFDKVFYLDKRTINSASAESILHTYPPGKVATVAKYERIQFSTTSVYKKPAAVHKHYFLRVELLGVLDDSSYTILATIDSPALVIRGRSPANYDPHYVYPDEMPARFQVARNPNSSIQMVKSTLMSSEPESFDFYQDKENHYPRAPKVIQREMIDDELLDPASQDVLDSQVLEENVIPEVVFDPEISYDGHYESLAGYDESKRHRRNRKLKQKSKKKNGFNQFKDELKRLQEEI